MMQTSVRLDQCMVVEGKREAKRKKLKLNLKETRNIAHEKTLFACFQASISEEDIQTPLGWPSRSTRQQQ